MPLARLAKARSLGLPEGYQFGDARPPVESLEGATFEMNGVTYVLGPTVVFPPDRVYLSKLCDPIRFGDYL